MGLTMERKKSAMISKRLFEHFKKDFPWYIPNISKYKANKDGGIDIYLVDGVVLNYQNDKNGFILKGGGYNKSSG